MRNHRAAVLTLLVATLAVACTGGEIQSPQRITTSISEAVFAREWSWSEPVHLDAPISSPFRDLGGTFSRDGLSLYFGSDRPHGGQGAFDIWVTHRTCRECPWGEPANLGPNINSATGDGSVTFSPDGRMMFFSGGHRPGGIGAEDIWVSRRNDPNDDLGWGPPTNLGPYVNTPANDQLPQLLFRGVGHAEMELIFQRAGGGFFTARLTADGEVIGPAVPVAELNDLSAVNAGETSDGADVFLFSATRTGGFGLRDIWVATRRNAQEPWSTPRNLGPMINTAGADLTPGLSWDGRTLVFAAGFDARPSLGFQDLWISTRSP